MKVQRWISAVLCAASLAGSMTVADAAAYPTVETGKSEEGVGYTLHYPKVYGMLDAKIAVVNDSWSGDGQRKEVELKLPVVASGDPFVLELTSGLTSARCPDCDKPLSMPSGSSGSSLANGTTYNGPCIVPLIGGDVYEINAEYAAYEDTFEWRGRTDNRLSKTDNCLEMDCAEDAVGLRAMTDLMIDPDNHFSYTPGNLQYDPNGDNSFASAFFMFQTGFYLRLPESTIEQIDFSKSYTTKELEALIAGEVQTSNRPALPTYNQNAPSQFASTAEVTGFGVGMADYGDMYVTITNPAKTTDAGIIALAAMNEKGASGKAGIAFIPYELAAGASKEYSVAMTGIVHEGIFDGVWESSGSSALLEEYAEASIITFEDDADLHAFYDTVPYESYVKPQGFASQFHTICDGVPGDTWLKNTLNFTRPQRDLSSIPYQNGIYVQDTIYADEVDHSACQGNVK